MNDTKMIKIVCLVLFLSFIGNIVLSYTLFNQQQAMDGLERELEIRQDIEEILIEKCDFRVGDVVQNTTGYFEFFNSTFQGEIYNIHLDGRGCILYIEDEGDNPCVVVNQDWCKRSEEVK